jgi:hypothetical protein
MSEKEELAQLLRRLAEGDDEEELELDSNRDVLQYISKNSAKMVSMLEELYSGYCMIQSPTPEHCKSIEEIKVLINHYHSVVEKELHAQHYVEQGDVVKALHAATLAGMIFQSIPALDFEKFLENLNAGRSEGVAARKITAEQNLNLAKKIIDGLFEYNSFRKMLGEGWRMSDSQIYNYLREKKVPWGDRHAKRTIGPYIDEVKARHFQK